MDVFFVAAFDAADDNSGGEASILQKFPGELKLAILRGRRSVREAAFSEGHVTWKVCPACANGVGGRFRFPPIFDVEIHAMGMKRGRVATSILSAEDDAGCAHGVDEAKFLNFRKSAWRA